MIVIGSGTIPYPTIRFKEGDYVVIYLKIWNLFRKFKKNQMTGKKIILIGIFLTVPLIGFAQNESSSFLNLWGESAKTAVGFFWKSGLSLIHISEPTRRTPISYAVFCLKKK